MSLVTNYEEFQNICRTCLFIGKLRPIIDSVVIEIIRGITGIEVKSDTELPQKICESCYKKIYKINEFAVQCKRNELALNKCKTDYYERKNNEPICIKNEITIEDDMVQVKEEIKTELHVPDSQQSHKCPECYKTFIRATELKKHQRLHKKVVFECDVCTKQFTESSALIEHHRTHKKQFPYTCDVCDKPIRHLMTLNRHKLIHKNQKAQCGVCFKIFYDLNALKVHRRIHTGLNPVVCKVCRKKFTSLHFLRRHYRVEHPNEDIFNLALRKITVEPKNEAAIEEVLIKSEPEEIISDVSSIIPGKSDQNKVDSFEATTNHKTKNEEHKQETQVERKENLLNTDQIISEKCAIESIDPQDLLFLSEEPPYNFDSSDPDPLCVTYDTDGNKNPINVETASNNDETYDNRFNPKRIRERNHCMFCKTTVLNFGRHLIRNHRKEPEVKTVLAAPVGSKQRKDLLSLLRKRGNYMINYKKCTKPVKKTRVANKFLPCTYCLGFYSTNQLWKHRKKCIANSSKGAKTNRPCADAQNLLVQHLKVDKTLKELVFPRMRADETSLVAKNDLLICALGARYIRMHVPEKHIVNVTSRKMRELAKLLVELKDLDSGIKSLVQALHPKYFDVVVAAVKTVAKYDEEKKVFATPTYAFQIGPTLKHCCEIAINEDDVFDFVLADVAKEEIRNFVTLLDTKWKLAIPNPSVEHSSLLEKTDNLDLENTDANQTLAPAPAQHVKTKETKDSSVKNRRILVPWTSEQKRVVDVFFKNHIAKRRAPKKSECDALIQAHPVLLHNKNWLKIKVYVQNKYSK